MQGASSLQDIKELKKPLSKNKVLFKGGEKVIKDLEQAHFAVGLGTKFKSPKLFAGKVFANNGRVCHLTLPKLEVFVIQ